MLYAPHLLIVDQRRNVEENEASRSHEAIYYERFLFQPTLDGCVNKKFYLRVLLLLKSYLTVNHIHQISFVNIGASRLYTSITTTASTFSSLRKMR